MIVPMSKVFIVSRSHDQDALLDALARLGVVHVEPVDPERAVPDEKTTDAISELDLGARILQGIEPAGLVPDAQPLQAAQEAIALHKAIVEEREQLNHLFRQADQLSLWGNVLRKDLTALREAGLEVRFYEIARKHLTADLHAECLEVVGELTGQQVVIAVVDRTGGFEPPAEANPLPWPVRDVPSIKIEAEQLDTSIRENNERLAALAHLIKPMQSLREQLDAKATVDMTQRSGLCRSSLFALQGWVPTRQTGSLSQELESMGLPAAVEVTAAQQDEDPPTLIDYPKWARPIKGLFDMLGTLPGYEEMDLGPFFMVALPLFAAMLIGDAGYGLILAGAGLVFYGKLVRAAGKPSTHLLIIFGLATLVWGILSANYFGITPDKLAAAGYARAAAIAQTLGVLWHSDANAARLLVMKISLVIGCLHLVVAHLRRAVQLFPDVRAWAEIAWMVILTDMLVLIWYLMFIGAGQIKPVVGWILLGGVAVVSWCTEPQANPFKRAMVGFASSILPLLGTFSDIMSYIRLFAVGLASYYIADAFNGLGAQVAAAATWFVGAPIVIFGHALNIGLAAIAIFAHGVRLNMLEFSNNVGVKWAGYAYQPFTKRKGTSIGENEL